MGTVRFSVGRSTSAEEIDTAANVIISAVRKLQPKYSDDENAELEQQENIEPVDWRTIKLTAFTHGLGCACKLRPQALEKVVRNLPKKHADPNVLIGTETGDDAAVYRVTDDLALVATLDFFTPIVDDPFQFGQIAAANSLSDVYAMGGKPVYALNIVGFPSNRLPLEVLEQILLGSQQKAAEAGVSIIGGHTIDDLEPKFGLSVTGLVHPKQILSNASARSGDVLVLTKPIGTGILTTAMKRGLVTKEVAAEVISVMSTLNDKPISLLPRFRDAIHSCTDVTGFGLLGHLLGMCKGSNLSAEISFRCVPLIASAMEHCIGGIVPGGSKNNLEYVSPSVEFDSLLSEPQKLLLADAQTSGGLLLAIAPDRLMEFVKELKELKCTAAVIGRFAQNSSSSPKVHVTI